MSGRGIKLSTGSISNLCDRFLVYLERLHLLRTPQLRAAMSSGYAVHLDATCEKGKGEHFICMDGIRGWVLLADRIDTEKGDTLKPLVQRAVDLFGDPMATVRDQGKGMAAAVAPLRERGIADLICHQHFLRAVGTKLFGVPYTRLRNLLKTSAARSGLVALRSQLRPYLEEVGPDGHFGPGRVRDELLALVHYLIEGPGGRDPTFPFALPHLELVLRCRAATDMTKNWPRPWNDPERRAMRTLDRLLHKLEKDPRMSPTVAALQDGSRVFRELRAVLRLDDREVLVGSRRPRQLPLAAAEMLQREDIRSAVREYEDDLRRRAGNEAKKKRPTKPEAIVLIYLARYGSHLFGHPVIRDDDGTIIAVVERTNNPPEHFFSGSKQLLRHRVGRASVARDLQQQPAQVALVLNLQRPDYVSILCGSIEHLPEAFASLGFTGAVDPTEIRLIRDHRDSHLDRLVKRLLEQFPPPETTKLPPPGWESNAHAEAS